jgi:hypothetical protein
MPPTPADYHELIRDAGLAALKAAVEGLDWQAVDELEAAARLTRPVGVVCCVGPEIERPELTTNLQDGLGYSFAVLLLGSGAARGEQQLGPKNLTQFRRLVRTTFHKKRLAGVAQVCWCEVSDSGPLVDEKSNLFQVLSTALVVTAVGRFPRS